MARDKSKRLTRARKRKGNQRVWSDIDYLELLAYLDWCVHKHADFRLTAIDHLRKVTGKTFSKRQITDKLKREWDKTKSPNDFEEVYLLGTKAVPPLSNQKQATLRRMMARIDAPITRMRLRSASTVLSRASRDPSVGDSIYSVPLSPQEQTTRLLKSNSWVQPSDMVQMENQNAAYKRSSHRTQAWALKDAGAQRQFSHNTMKEEDDSDLSSTHSSAFLDYDSTIFFGEMKDADEDASSTLKSDLEDSEAAKLEFIQEELLRYKGYAFSLRNRLSETSRELEELKNSIHAPTMDHLRMKQQMSNLRAQLATKHCLLDHDSKYDNECLGLPFREIPMEQGSAFSNVHESSSLICDGNENGAVLEPSGGFCQLVQSWSTRVSGWTLEQLLTYCHSTMISNLNILQALISAGISELVYEQVFPETLALESPILNEYRKQIFTRDGLRSLRRIDLIALKSLTMYTHFESDIIPSKARMLSEIFLSSLKPFLPTEIGSVTENRPLDERDEEFLLSLSQTLAHVLLFKVNLALSGRKFKFYFFKPGELFDSGIMDRDRFQFPDRFERRDKVKGFVESSRSDIHVKLCLLPALYLSQEVGDLGKNSENSETECPISYQKCITQASKDELNSLVLIAKGVVLLASPD